MDTIWQDTLDGEFDCKVVRTGMGTGQLTVKNGDGVLILSEEVPLMYGAQYGPDAEDVVIWQEMCVKAVDGECNGIDDA